ncbi:MAG: hypothetical protein L0216_05375 [Planctomycetales bacterium]|nr:hypothetical protein [Planctomycetales bacterium]
MRIGLVLALLGIAAAGCGEEPKPAAPAPSTGVTKPMRKAAPRSTAGPTGSGFGSGVPSEDSATGVERPARTMAPEMEDLDEAITGAAAPAGPRARWQCPVCASESATAGRCCGRERVELK